MIEEQLHGQHAEQRAPIGVNFRDVDQQVSVAPQAGILFSEEDRLSPAAGNLIISAYNQVNFFLGGEEQHRVAFFNRREQSVFEFFGEHPFAVGVGNFL